MERYSIEKQIVRRSSEYHLLHSRRSGDCYLRVTQTYISPDRFNYIDCLYFSRTSREKASAQYDGARTAQSARTMNVSGREEVDMNGNSSRHHMSGELSTASPTEVIPPQRPGPQQPVVKGALPHFESTTV